MAYDRYVTEFDDNENRTYGVMDAEAREEVSNVKSAINDVSKRIGTSNIQWSNIVENKYWRASDGQFVSNNNTKSVYTDFVPCNPGDKFLYTGQTNYTQVCPCALYYAEDGSFIGAEDGNPITPNGDQKVITIPENAHKVLFQLAVIGSSVPIENYDVVQTTPSSVEFIESKISKIDDNLLSRVGSNITWVEVDNKLISMSDGKLANYNYCKMAYTGMIQCMPGNVFLYEGYTNEQSKCACAFYYDQNSEYIGYEPGYIQESLAQEQKRIVIPDNAHFVRFQIAKTGLNQTLPVYKANQISPYSTDSLKEKIEKVENDFNVLGGMYFEPTMIYDKSEVKYGLINTSDGTVDETNKNFLTTGFIEVDPEKVYAVTLYYDLVCYDENKAFKGSSSYYLAYHNPTSFINFIDKEVKYVRISTRIGNKDNFTIALSGVYSNQIIGKSLKINEGLADAISECGLYQIAEDNPTIFRRARNLFNIYSSNWAYMAGLKTNTGMLEASGNHNSGVITTDYIPVTEGDVVCSNMGIYKTAAYDENKSFVQDLTNRSAGQALCWIAYIPANVAYIRMSGNFSDNGYYGYDTEEPNGWIRSDNEINKWLIWKADNSDKLYPRDTAPETNYALHKIPGEYVDVDYSVVPDRNTEFMRMIRCESIRAVNHTKHVYRIGNFNQYVQRHQNNWPTIKNMLADYGIDICGFEEAQYFQSQAVDQKGSIGDYMRGWQFGYCPTFYPSGTIQSPYSNRDAVSIFPIMESEEIQFPNVGQSSYNNRSALRTKIKLPRYLDCTGGDQYLGFYVIHPTVDASYSQQEAEIQVCLDAMETDGCAFHIIAADSNAFDVNPETGMPIVWDWLISKGFKIANNGWSKTVTDPSPDHQGSIDQIFVSDNINIINFNVINSNEYAYIENGTLVPLSDHDFIYADVEFDYSDVITKLRPMTEVALIQNLTHVASDTPNNYHLGITQTTTTITRNFEGTLNNAVTVNLTAETGYTLSDVTVYVGGVNKTNDYYSNGVVNVPAGATVRGDIVITATAG